ncbi:hypothetical protein K439DRAFT_1624953 [Ramaria rubella]|nr:hypothetical protein K439DRAFT_1624953 [Ramaria rubella]
MNCDPQLHPGIFNFNRIPTELERLRSSLSPGHQAFTVIVHPRTLECFSLKSSSHFNFHTQALLLNLHARTLWTGGLHSIYGMIELTIRTETLLIRPDCWQVQTQLPFLGRYSVPALETGLEHVVAVPPSSPGNGGLAHDM